MAPRLLVPKLHFGTLLASETPFRNRPKTAGAANQNSRTTTTVARAIVTAQ